MAKKDPKLEKTIQFIKAIGIGVVETTITETTFLPGLALGPNTIYVDYWQLKYPGDMLHEAGHIAVTAANERALIGSGKMPEAWPTPGDEIAAILWSYAALTHLDLPVEYVFHENGYKDDSKWLIENFTSGTYIGLPLLQWFKMAYSNKQVSQNKTAAFPAMQYWIRPD